MIYFHVRRTNNGFTISTTHHYPTIYSLHVRRICIGRHKMFTVPHYLLYSYVCRRAEPTPKSATTACWLPLNLRAGVTGYDRQLDHNPDQPNERSTASPNHRHVRELPSPRGWPFLAKKTRSCTLSARRCPARPISSERYLVIRLESGCHTAEGCQGSRAIRPLCSKFSVDE